MGVKKPNFSYRDAVLWYRLAMRTKNLPPEGTGSPKKILGFAIGALILSVLMNLYHFSLEGTGGLYTWHPILALKLLVVMGLGPLVVAVLYLVFANRGPAWFTALLRWLSLIGSALVSLGSIALLAFLILVPRIGTLTVPPLSLIDPGKGLIIPNRDPSPAPSKGTTSAETPSAPLLRLSFSSDPHWGAPTSKSSARTQILQQIGQGNRDAFFMLGDTVETGNSVSQWNAALSELGTYLSQVPLRVLLGNHDALFGGQYLFKRAFFPPPFSSDSGSPYYWKLNAGAATIVAVDLPWGTEMFGAKQRQWLEKTLAAADHTKPLIVISHSFFYASGYDDPDLGSPWYDHYQNIPALTGLFEKYGVDLVVSGHNHYQELLSHNGVTYVIIGSMGGLPDPAPTHLSPASQWLGVGKYGWLDVDILSDRMILTFRSETGAERYRLEMNRGHR